MKTILPVLFLTISLGSFAQIIIKSDSVAVMTDTKPVTTYIPDRDLILTRKFQISALTGMTVLYNDLATELLKKNNVIHYGGELNLGNYKDFFMIPFVAVHGYKKNVDATIDTQSAKVFLSGLQVNFGFRAKLLGNHSSSLYASIAYLFGKSKITQDLYYTEYNGLRLGIGLERLMSRRYLKCFAEACYESNWETRAYRKINSFYDLNQFKIQLGLRF